MYKAPTNFSAPKAAPLNYWPAGEVLFNGGLNLVDREWKIPDNQTNKTVNMWWQNGELGCRWGQAWLKSDEVVESPCYSAYKYPYCDYIIKHCGTKLYKQDPVIGVSTSIYSGVTAAKSGFFKFNGKLYFKQSGKYLEINDSLTVSAVVPYIPTVIINRTPTGGGNTNEQYNRLGSGFKNSFNGNNSATAYTLTDTNLDATTVKAWIGGVLKTEGVDFTVNRTTGIVTFGVAPANGTNNIVIEAYKTVQADIDTILNCTIATPFGGQNDNRMFFAGNGTGLFFWSGISSAGIDPTYFPYNNYNVIGLSDENITEFGKSYDVLTIHKESGEIYGETYTWNGTVGIFNTYPINGQYGCDCPGTMQNINNNLVWLNSKHGVCILLRTDVGSQRNAFPISRNINSWLMQESSLKTASSVDFNGKYWLCVGDKVYLWDYFTSPYVDTGNPDENAKRLSWWYFNNISASCFIINDTVLLYGSRTSGKVAKFITNFNDFGSAINPVYRIPLRDLGGSKNEFDVLTMWVDVRTDTRTKLNITYIMNDESDIETESATIDVGSFSLPGFAIPTFTLNVVGNRQTFTFEPQEKKIDLFGVEFTNTEVDRDMNVSNVEIAYRLGKRKR